MMIICYLYYIRFLDTKKLFTINSVREELLACHDQKIEQQKKYFEMHQFDSYTVIGFEKTDEYSRNDLENNIVKFIEKYHVVTKNNQFKMTSTMVEKSYKHHNDLFLNFFQNAYTFNHCISANTKTNYDIKKEFSYYIQEINDPSKEMRKAINLHKSWCKDNLWQVKNQNNMSKDKNVLIEFLLIDNCLNTLEDYELFYNEFLGIKHNFHNQTVFIFIILNLNETQKQVFCERSPYSDLHVRSNSSFDDLNYVAFFLENRKPFGHFSIDQNDKHIWANAHLATAWTYLSIKL
ncbi:hypothetical protein COBT_002606 [Conglomerata obtusa]